MCDKRVSYCLYLVQQHVFVFLSGRIVRNHLGTGTGAALSVIALGFVLGFSIASLSWYQF